MSDRTQDHLPTRWNWFGVLLGIAGLAALYAVSQRNFLLFHCLTEAFSIVIAIAVYAIFWNTRRFLESGFYLIIGLGCLFAGLLDLVYIFAYPGMSVFPGADGNIALQAKTVAQWYVSLSCVCATLFLRRKVHQNLALLLYSAVLALALAAIFYWRSFPDCFLEGAGITAFERIGLAISCGAYLGAFLWLVRNRHEFDSYVFKLLAATLLTFFVQDFACAVASEMNGFARTVAHLCQVVALYFVYKAFVEVGLTQPYAILLRSQQQAQEILKVAHDEQLQRHQAELAHVARLSMMGEMAASLAHELNQPLSAVHNYASGSLLRLRQSPHRDAEVVAALEQIAEEAQRAAEIVRRVRRFLQKREPRFSEVLLNNLVEEVVLFSRAELEQRHAKVVLELAEDLPVVMGDPVQIEQVIMNLVRNGLEAMEETPVEQRRLRIKTLGHADGTVQVDVCDCGPGVGGEYLEQVFEPFFTTKPEGMGMGLAISRSIIQMHGGRLWLSANQDQGCTFHFTLHGAKGS